jgi:hypothetical protein
MVTLWIKAADGIILNRDSLILAQGLLVLDYLSHKLTLAPVETYYLKPVLSD